MMETPYCSHESTRDIMKVSYSYKSLHSAALIYAHHITPGTVVLQSEDVNGLCVTGGTEKLFISTERQGTDADIPKHKDHEMMSLQASKLSSQISESLSDYTSF